MRFKAILLTLLSTFFLLPPRTSRGELPTPTPTAATETIVFVRHGEKPAKDLGQLNFQGLNRALALPEVLIGKYGKADVIYAPGTHHRIPKNGIDYSYIRPLITIEPTAIRLGLPIDARFGYDETAALSEELLSPARQGSLVFVAWEHVKLEQMVRAMVERMGGDAKAVPRWPSADFDSIYVVRIITEGGVRRVIFQVDHEGLDGMSTESPEPKRNR